VRLGGKEQRRVSPSTHGGAPQAAAVAPRVRHGRRGAWWGPGGRLHTGGACGGWRVCGAAERKVRQPHASPGENWAGLTSGPIMGRPHLQPKNWAGLTSSPKNWAGLTSSRESPMCDPIFDFEAKPGDVEAKPGDFEAKPGDVEAKSYDAGPTDGRSADVSLGRNPQSSEGGRPNEAGGEAGPIFGA
jgi:hypothetical protein